MNQFLDYRLPPITHDESIDETEEDFVKGYEASDSKIRFDCILDVRDKQMHYCTTLTCAGLMLGVGRETILNALERGELDGYIPHQKRHVIWVRSIINYLARLQKNKHKNEH